MTNDADDGDDDGDDNDNDDYDDDDDDDGCMSATHWCYPGAQDTTFLMWWWCWCQR